MGLRFKKTLTKYVLSELLNPFLLGLLIFTFVLLMERVLQLIELVISKGVNLRDVLELLFYLMPSFLVLTIPMAVLVATLTAFGRLSTDSEITAMKASGISLYSLFSPVLLFAFAAALLTFFLYVKALPWGNHNFRVTSYELARTKASIGLKEHVFNRDFPGLDIYIDEISDSGETFEGVMISDARDIRNQQIIFAKKGRLITDEKALRVVLRLFECATHPKVILNPQKYHIAASPSLDILLTLQNSDDASQITLPRTDRDMTFTQLAEKYLILRKQQTPPAGTSSQPGPAEQSSELAETFEDETWLATLLVGAKLFVWDSFYFNHPLSNPYLLEIHKRFSIPFACIVFGLIATPLGIQSKRAGKSGGYGISLALILIYYIFISAGESLGDDGKLPVFFAVWTPNLLLGISGLFLLIRMARR